jgi:hypothetical protein
MEKDHTETDVHKAGDELAKARTTDCGTMEIFGLKEQRKLVRKIDVKYVVEIESQLRDSWFRAWVLTYTH